MGLYSNDEKDCADYVRVMNLQNNALLTDLYQLTMLQGYFEQEMEASAVFEFFVRSLPVERNFLVVAGLEQVLDYLQGLHFVPEELKWLEGSGRFSAEFMDYLSRFRFTGDVHAMAEGTVFFPHEPVLRITAPLPQAQFVESRIINLLHFQTLIASKAARCVLTAPGKRLVDFGMRRAHGAEAGLLAARAAYLAGFEGTATVFAGFRYGIPLFGTMAHSFIQAHDSERVAFANFARAQPHNVVLLIDTYDTLIAARKVVELAPALQEANIEIKGVRIDSGNPAAIAHKVRRILDDAGYPQMSIFASGNLNEYVLQEIIASGAPIDGFGVGTHLDTSADRPYLDCAYKLQEYAGKARRKRSEGKATWPGRKQVYRYWNDKGRLCHDVVTLEGDEQRGQPLLQPVMVRGERLYPERPLQLIRDDTLEQFHCLPPELRRLHGHSDYKVHFSPALRRLVDKVDQNAM